MKPKKEIIKQFEEHYGISRHGCRSQWNHIEKCRAFYDGDYMNYKDDVLYGRGSSRRLKEVSFNRVKPYVNSVVGFFAQQRRKPIYQAKIEDSQEQVAYSDYLNGYSDYIRDNSNSDQMETRQDLDLVVGGIGCTDTGITTKQGLASRLPGGEVIEERVDMLQVGYDPAAVLPNILDSRWIYRAKDYDIEEAEELFNAEEEDFEAMPEDDEVFNYQFNPYGGITDKIGYEWADPQRRMVRVYFYQWFEVENFYRVENPIFIPGGFDKGAFFAALSFIKKDEDEEVFRFDPSAQILCVTKDIQKGVKAVFEAFDVPYKPITEKRKVFYTAIISGKKCFQAYKSVSQQGFTLKFKTGDRNETDRIWTGLVASMIDPQRYYNKALTELMLIIASNSRGGVMYEADAIDDVQRFEQNYARTNAAVRVNPGALSGGKIQAKATPALPTGYEDILQLSGSALSQVTGIDESFFGAIGGGNETAMLQRQRIKQATTILATYADSKMLYDKEQARMMLSFIRLLADSNEGQMFHMRNDDGGLVYETVSKDFLADEYDVVIGEAPDTATQKEYYTQTLITLGQSMQAIGDPRYAQIYALAIKQLPLPERDKAAVNKILLGGEQIDPALVQQLQQRVAELEGKQTQLLAAKMTADISKTQAETEKTLAAVRKAPLEERSLSEDIEKKAIENDMLSVKPISEVTVTI